jgi:hypothetical protein
MSSAPVPRQRRVCSCAAGGLAAAVARAAGVVRARLAATLNAASGLQKEALALRVVLDVERAVSRSHSLVDCAGQGISEDGAHILLVPIQPT